MSRENKSTKAVGIVAEFNPFHQGHGYLISRAKEEFPDAVIVSTMSGSFVQRGGIAYFDKWHRAKTAVENGVDLVIELPVVYASSSSNYFAKGAVNLLEKIGCDTLAFGTECDDVKVLKSVADKLTYNMEKINHMMAIFMKDGSAYPSAREKALKEFITTEEMAVLSGSNNILALDYILNNDKMKLFSIKRNGQGHHESGTRIREILYKNNPNFYAETEKNYFKMVVNSLIGRSREELIGISGDEGLVNKLFKEFRYVKSTDELILAVKSKGYTYTRISRLLAQILLGIKRDDADKFPGYIRVLALNGRGSRFLKAYLKGNGELPVISNINKFYSHNPNVRKQLELDIKSTDIFNIITGRDLYENSDYVQKPYYESNLDF